MFKRIVTLAFVALAVGMAIPSTRAQIAGSFQPIKDEIGERLVPRRVNVMADQLDVRLGRGEGLPANFHGWLRRDYTGAPEDPWGNIYYLEEGRRDYTVGSMGADGVQGTSDDITVTRRYPDRR
ncbi:MAG: type II secretion system protein GspG [Longimicrobiales bacterium]|nr:type II secretion system protein GspG [Longimicrobiales bacterium]